MNGRAPTGRAWVLGDRIDTDVLAPGHAMKWPEAELAACCLQAVRPEFATEVRKGDVIVAGSGFGIGSSREQAAASLRLLGVRAVMARSFGGIFRRNAINLGLPALVLHTADGIEDGDELSLDLDGATVRNVTQGRTIAFEPLPRNLLHIVDCGGLLPWLEAGHGSEVLTQGKARGSAPGLR